VTETTVILTETPEAVVTSSETTVMVTGTIFKESG
jgi:hypothetical protein